MPGPWERYQQQGAAPVIAPPDPYKQAAEQRAQAGEVRAHEDQGFQAEQLRLAQDAAVRAEETAQRAREEAQRGSVEQGKTAGFLRRAIQAERDFGALGSVEPRSLPGQAFKDAFPNAANYVSDADRQRADQAERAFIGAVLRYDSGAAIPPEEFVTQGQIYFPRPGDTPEVLKQKAQARRTAISGLLQSAGPAGDTVWNELGGIEDLPAASPDGSQEGLSGTTTDDSPLEVRVTDDRPDPTNLGPDGKPRITGNDPAYAQIAAGFGDLVEGGLNNTIGLLANPVNTNLFRALGYDNYTSNIGATAREGLGLPYGNETIGAINQAASGGLSMAGGANALATRFAPSMARNALLAYGERPMLDMATGGSAAASGEAARQMGAGPGGQAIATVLGGGVPSAVVGSRNALAGFTGGRPPPDFDPAVVRAGERQAVPIRLPDAVPSERGRMANAAQTPHGGPRIAAVRAADQDAVEARVQTVGGDGAVQDNYAAGTTVQRAADRHIARTRAQANRLYDRARVLAGDARVTARNADAALDRNIQELRAAGENTNAGAIRYLEGLRSDIDRGLTVSSVQNLRTNMRGQLNERSLTGTDTERRVQDVIASMNQDLAEQLPEGAAQALEGADQFYRTRMEFIEQVSQRFIGPDNNRVPAETAAQRLLSMVNGKGDAERFARMWRELEPEEQADLSATIAASLGRKANGEFSLSTLIRSLDPGKGINPRTARLVFGEDGARALADLRTIAAAKTATQQGMNNSNTGATITRGAGSLKTLLLGALGYSAGGPVGAVGGALSRDIISRLSEQRTARLLLNPNFTRWLRDAPDTADPRAIDSYFRRLATQSAKSPILAGDARALQEALTEAFSRSPGRLAAAEQEQN